MKLKRKHLNFLTSSVINEILQSLSCLLNEIKNIMVPMLCSNTQENYNEQILNFAFSPFDQSNTSMHFENT